MPRTRGARNGTRPPAPEAGAASGSTSRPARPLRVCLVKQHTTYDLYTKTGPDLRGIVASSNWRAGPLGLWEAFDCEFRIVHESPDHECQIGKTHWAQYVEGWNIWPEGSVAEGADSVDWGRYDIVICVDVAIPTRIVAEYPRTMWCYYFIEHGFDESDRGSPYFGYNVFLNHRVARSVIDRNSPSSQKMVRERRAILDFPYYMMTSTTIADIYGVDASHVREGIMMTAHSHEAISPDERVSLDSLIRINRSGNTLVDVHRDVLQSEYCVVYPWTRRMTGLALVEAISGGCVALAPRRLVAGFPDLLFEELDYSDFAGLLRVIERLQVDEDLRTRVRAHQVNYVNSYFYRNPQKNMEFMYAAFRESGASRGRQARSERRDRVLAETMNLGLRLKGRAARAMVRVRGADAT